MKQKASSSSLSKSSKAITIISSEREKGWYVPANNAIIPKYDAYSDPNCPRAQVLRYNQERAAAAKARASQSEKYTKQWINQSLQSKIEEVPVRLHTSLREKAMNSIVGKESKIEVDILQKVIVRENMLTELHKLLDNQVDVNSCLNEVVELVKAIRFQTVDIIEDINNWQYSLPTIRPFLFRGTNYLIKISYDLDFLDSYEEIVEKFCFEFKRNPLAYKEGGFLITGTSSNDEGGPEISKQNKGGKQRNNTYNITERSFIDGIEVVRLHNSERAVQREFERLAEEKRNYEAFDGTSASVNLGESGMSMVMSNDQYQTRDDRNKSEKKKIKFNGRRIKLERISTLSNEAAELKAMESHIEDQVNALVEKYQKFSSKRQNSEAKRKEALSLGREVAAQHIAVEISILTADMQEINSKIKELQRQSYFISLERKRKQKVVRQLTDEVNEEKRRTEIQKKLSEKIKEGGLLSALKTLNKVDMDKFAGEMLAKAKGEQIKEQVITEEDMLNTMTSFSPKKGKVRPPGLSRSLDSYKMSSSSPSLPRVVELDIPQDHYIRYNKPQSPKESSYDSTENVIPDESSIRSKRMQSIDEKLKHLDDLEFEISMKERDLLNIASEADERFSNISTRENSLIEELSKQQDDLPNENNEDVSILSKSILNAPNPDEQALLEIEIEKAQLIQEKENALSELARLQSERNGIRLMIEEQTIIYQKLSEEDNIHNEYNNDKYIDNIQDNSIQDNVYDNENEENEMNYNYPVGTGLNAVTALKTL